jgi:hypothetical protein
MPIQTRTGVGQQLIEPALGAAVVLVGQEPARDAGLIGDYHREPPGGIQLTDCLRGSRQKAYLPGFSNVAHVGDDGAVSIQKDRPGPTVRRPAYL